MTPGVKKTISWSSVEPLDSGSHWQNGGFASLDALHRARLEYFDTLTPQQQIELRQRSLRRLAVETGIIERLYDLDWGLTLTIVAEGFSREIVERAGGRIDEWTLQTLIAQRDSSEMVLEVVRGDRPLSPGFIKDIHAALTQTQETHEVIDSLGMPGKRPLEHGAWKTHSNWVERPDGTRIEFCPYEQVASEIENLLKYLSQAEASGAHPIVTAAWFHYWFVRIHPFEDGNGRVARALTFLVLEKNRYAPLVVDRFHRAAYLDALHAANLGDLRALVHLFVSLESAALTSELEAPEPVNLRGESIEVAHTLAQQLAARRAHAKSKLNKALHARAVNIEARAEQWFKNQEQALRDVFHRENITDAQVDFLGFGLDGKPHATGDKRSVTEVHWFRGDIIVSARTVGHFANFDSLCAWWELRIRLKNERVQLKYVASLHGAGRDAGVGAIVSFADIAPYSPREASGPDAASGIREIKLIRTSTDAFRFVHSESTEALMERATELDAFLESGLSVALAELLQSGSTL